MSDPTTEDRLADLLLVWEERFEAGEDVPAAELCADPDLIPDLTARIDLLRKVAWVNRHPPAAQEPGARLPPTEPLAGRYRLDALIGQGGYGQVWRGFDLELHRPVAVKLPQPAHVGRSSGEDHILAEARKVARLAHPGIVPVYDVGRHGTGYFIVSELIDGDDLARRLRGDGLTVREAVRVVAEAARHVHYAHTQGFVHRDIKPANLLLDRQGRVFVTDFGIAVPTDDSGRASDGAGTLAYMAPEQLFPDHTRVDPRTDVYALGVVLYRAVTGTLPFPACAPSILRHQILHTEPPSPRSVHRAIPSEVERICLRCLAKSPANRYPTAEALADDLARWLRRGVVGRVVGWATRPFVSPAVHEPLGVPVEGRRTEGSPTRPNGGTTEGECRTRPSRRREILLAFGGLFGAAVLVGMWLVIGRDFARNDPTAEVTSQEPLVGIVQPPIPKPDEEVELFNGRNLDGWSFHTSTKGYGPDDAVRIKDGTLALRGVDHPGKPRRLQYRITTTRKYADFVLTLEYRLPVGGAKTAAGGCLLLRVQNSDLLAQANLRVKLGSRSAAGQPLLPGNDPDADAVVPPAAKPDGEWNSLEVRCVGPTVIAVLNGVKTGEVGRADEGEGFIGLTTQGSDMEFRALRVRVHRP